MKESGEFVEPKHRMYLNSVDKNTLNAAFVVEPKHRMYLNKRKRIYKRRKMVVEPKHRMYLNSEVSQAVNTTVLRRTKT